MQTFKQAIGSAPLSASNKPSANGANQTPTTSRSPLPKSATDELWMRMASRYGHAWVSQYGPLPDGIAAAEWRGTLSNVTAAQLRKGFEVDAARGSDWPPSSPRFLAMCFGIPTVAIVRAEVQDRLSYRPALGEKRTPPVISRFSRGVIDRLDTYAYRNATGKAADRIFDEAFQRTREFVMEGGELPSNPVAYIEKHKPEPKPADPKVVAEHLASLREILRDPEPEASEGSA